MSSLFEYLFFLLSPSWTIMLCFFVLLFAVFILADSSFVFGCVMDDLSFLMTELTFILTVLVYLNFKVNAVKIDWLFVLLLFLLQLGMVGFFNSSFSLAFFVMFELTLIPILLIILGWGYQVERIQASFYLLMYMVVFSLPCLLGLLFLGVSMDSFSLMGVSWMETSVFLEMMLFFVFWAKTPVYFLHLWLPKAHVEAPVMGSIFLAGIMLKMGGYGWYRLVCFISGGVNIFFQVVFFVGFVCAVLVSILQTDMKSLIALSSISHMTLMFVGVSSMMTGSYMVLCSLMFSHGLISSAMFSNINNLSAFSTSRMFYFIQGFSHLMFGLIFLNLLMLMLNFSVPPSLGFVAEVLVTVLVVYSGHLFSVGLLLGVVFVCYYNIMMFFSLLHGKSGSPLVVSASFELDFFLLAVYMVLTILIVLMMGLFF